jgi:hypothetical protein
VARRRLFGGIAAVAVLGGGAYLLLSGGKVEIPFVDSPPPVTFTFDDVTVAAAPTSTNKGSLPERRADKAGEQVATVLNSLYTVAYVEDDYWGDYGDAWSLFEDDAAQQAESDLPTLTLGPQAGDLYEKVAASPSSTLAITVLTDRRDQPISAIAQVVFEAEAKLRGGGASAITSEGSFFLRPSGDEWLIYAYEVDRNEEETAPSSPSAEASP